MSGNGLEGVCFRVYGGLSSCYVYYPSHTNMRSTEKTFCRKFRGMNVMDGGLTCNTPVFRDGIRRQLIFRLSQVGEGRRVL